MRQDWIIEVLTDLQAFARRNDLPALAAQVETTLLVARAELAGKRADAGRDLRDPRRFPGGKPH